MTYDFCDDLRLLQLIKMTLCRCICVKFIKDWMISSYCYTIMNLGMFGSSYIY